MAVTGIVAVLALTALGSFFFSAVTYSLRNVTRVRLADYLQRHNKSRWLEKTLDRVEDLTLVTAVMRMVANTLLVLASFALAHHISHQPAAVYAMAAILASVITFFCSVAFPSSLAAHAPAEIVGLFVRPLHGIRVALTPVMGLMRGIDNLVRSATGVEQATEAEEIQQEILSVVEEGEKEGVVDEQEREMIESVIEFRDTTAGQIMTPRPRVVGIEQNAPLSELQQAFDDSGHSRLPVYNGTLDQVVGILYARDLLRHLGSPTSEFNIKSTMRPAYYVPETRPLRDLLRDFRLQKIHIAVVLDEYGGTAGLVSIEDVLEELVGGNDSETSTGEQPAMFKRLTDNSAEADARLPVAEVNRLTGLNLPEDAGYDTLGGFVSTTIGRIPEKDFSIEYGGTRFTVLEAEPQKINRLRIDQPLPTPLTEPIAVEANT